jgi:hypothetical protein
MGGVAAGAGGNDRGQGGPRDVRRKSPSGNEGGIKPGLALGMVGAGMVGIGAVFYPFLAPALRKHVLP